MRDSVGVFERVEAVPLHWWQSYRNMIAGVAGTMPLIVAGCKSREMRHTMREMLTRHKYDVVYVVGVRMAQYIGEAKGSYKVLDLCDSVALLLRRMLKHSRLYVKPLMLREWLAVKRYERLVALQADECWFTSSVDRECLSGLPVGGKVFLVPNGVDTVYLAPDEVQPRSNDILFVGYMGAESVDAVTYFCREVFPSVRREVPGARFRIIGANPPQRVRRLARIDGVSVEGFVEDLRAVYRQCSVAVAPVRFSVGIQNKVLEAMAMGIPVVATPEGNGGTGATSGKELFVCDNPQRFAEAVITVLRDEGLRMRMGAQARAFVQERFRWSLVADRMEEIERQVQMRNESVAN